MEKLETLLKIENKAARQEALTRLARTLRVNLSQARKSDGTIDEDALTVLLYDAQKSVRLRKTQNWGLILGSAFMTLAALAAILLLSKLFAGGTLFPLP